MKKIGLVLGLTLLLTGCAETPEKMPEPVEQPEPELAEPVAPVEPWRDAYKAFLTELCEKETAIRNIDRPDYDPIEYQWELAELSNGYCLYDIDKNGTPELFIRYGGGEVNYRTQVYTCLEDAVAEVGEFPSGHSSLYTYPDGNGVTFDWGHMDGQYMDRISLVDGGLVRETIFEKEPSGKYSPVTDIVPGAELLWENRTILGRYFMDEGVTGKEAPLLLPIDEYGVIRVHRGIDPVRDEAARTAIQAVLDGERPLFGVSADGFGGDTGELLLADYLAVGGVDRYAKVPQAIRKLAWLDMNGDGQTECLLYLQGDEGQVALRVILAEENGTVYAYCDNYGTFSTVTEGGVFRNDHSGDAYALSFAGEQCYQYAAPYDPAVPEVDWQSVS